MGIDFTDSLPFGAMAMGASRSGTWAPSRDPERYGNIAVRVAGYSQMFKLVNKELQDHIIARTNGVRPERGTATALRIEGRTGEGAVKEKAWK